MFNVFYASNANYSPDQMQSIAGLSGECLYAPFWTYLNNLSTYMVR